MAVVVGGDALQRQIAVISCTQGCSVSLLWVCSSGPVQDGQRPVKLLVLGSCWRSLVKIGARRCRQECNVCGRECIIVED